MSRSRICSCTNRAVAPHFSSAEDYSSVAPYLTHPPAKGSSRRLDLVPVRGSAAKLQCCPPLSRILGTEPSRLLESCPAGCQAGFPNHRGSAFPRHMILGNPLRRRQPDAWVYRPSNRPIRRAHCPLNLPHHPTAAVRHLLSTCGSPGSVDTPMTAHQDCKNRRRTSPY